MGGEHGYARPAGTRGRSEDKVTGAGMAGTSNTQGQGLIHLVLRIVWPSRRKVTRQKDHHEASSASHQAPNASATKEKVRHPSLQRKTRAKILVECMQLQTLAVCYAYARRRAGLDLVELNLSGGCGRAMETGCRLTGYARSTSLASSVGHQVCSCSN
jgi:hypothetical protein